MTKAENIRNQCMKILDKYDADYRGVTVDRIDGTTYVIFKYYGGTNDTVDRNDDSWDEMFELDGVVDVGYGEGYGIKGKYEDSLLIELDKDIVESKKSARKSLKEEKEVWIIKSKDDLQYVGKKIFDVCEDIENARKFKSKFEAEEFLKKHDKALDYRYWKVINIVSESKESLKESYPNYDIDDVYKELKRLCDKGKYVFSDFDVERGENRFVVSISDDSSYIKLKDFIPFNIHYNENSFYMYYKNDSTYMTIFANYEDENAINVLVEVVRSLASLKGAYDKCETVSTEIVNQVSNLY